VVLRIEIEVFWLLTTTRP